LAFDNTAAGLSKQRDRGRSIEFADTAPLLKIVSGRPPRFDYSKSERLTRMPEADDTGTVW
jgi:hypothetical protein